MQTRAYRVAVTVFVLGAAFAFGSPAMAAGCSDNLAKDFLPGGQMTCQGFYLLSRMTSFMKTSKSMPWFMERKRCKILRRVGSTPFPV
jgi:hypothetical protein